MNPLLFLLSTASVHHYQNPLFHDNPIDQYCIIKEKGICTFCINSSIDDKGRCNRITSFIKNCVIYDKEKDCAICEPGFELKQGHCVKSEPNSNCLVFYKDNNCLLCKKGMMEANGHCVPQQKCTLPNCNHCTDIADQELCLICKKGFSVRMLSETKFECVPDSGLVKNCLFTNKDNECQACKINYFMYNGKCLQSKFYYFDLDVLYS
mgnify:CR=1 FL=1